MRYKYVIFTILFVSLLQPLFSTEILDDDNDELSLAIIEHAKADEPDYANYNWSKIIIGGAFGKNIGLKKGYAEFGLLAGIPIQERAQLFGDARAFYYFNSCWSGSLGIGVRYACKEVCDENYDILGVNCYYDGIQATFGNDSCCLSRRYFNRIGIGIEYLSSCLNLSLNGYLPVGRSTYGGNDSHYYYLWGYQGNRTKAASLPWGGDFEVGKNYCVGTEAINAYLGIGAYYYKFKERHGLTGVQVRVELSWQDFLSLQFLYSYDHKFTSKYQGKVLLSIPLYVFFHCLYSAEIESCNEFVPWKECVTRNNTPFVEGNRCRDRK